MKIQQEKEGFKPITIIIETEKEAIALKTITGNIKGHGYIRDLVNTIYESIGDDILTDCVERSMILGDLGDEK